MSIENPLDNPPEATPEEIESPEPLETLEGTDVEKGDSFLQHTGTKLKEVVKTFFSVPEEGKVMNIMEKVGGIAFMGFLAKVAMDQRFNDLVATGDERQKFAFAALVIGAMGILPVMHALEKQYREKKKRKQEQKNT